MRRSGEGEAQPSECHSEKQANCDVRDKRAEAFTTLLWAGSYRYRYTARATTPGTFTAGPAKAEEMYSPEVFGRAPRTVVVIE